MAISDATTLRRYGASEQRSEDFVVVHTEDYGIYRQLREWQTCQSVVQYEQWQSARVATTNPLGRVVVGFDLYFPANQEDTLRKVLGLTTRRKGIPRGRSFVSQDPLTRANNCVNRGSGHAILRQVALDDLGAVSAPRKAV